MIRSPRNYGHPGTVPNYFPSRAYDINPANTVTSLFRNTVSKTVHNYQIASRLPPQLPSVTAEQPRSTCARQIQGATNNVDSNMKPRAWRVYTVTSKLSKTAKETRPPSHLRSLFWAKMQNFSAHISGHLAKVSLAQSRG